MSNLVGSSSSPAKNSVDKFLFLIELIISEPNSFVCGLRTLPISFLRLERGIVLFIKEASILFCCPGAPENKSTKDCNPAKYDLLVTVEAKAIDNFKNLSSAHSSPINCW